MKKIFSLMLVSFLMIANSYAGYYDMYQDDPTKIVSQDGTMYIDLAQSVLTCSLEENEYGAGAASELYVYLVTYSSNKSFHVSLQGDYFFINGSPDQQSYANRANVPYRFVAETGFDPENGPQFLQAGVYSAVLTISDDSNNSMSVVLTATVGDVPAAGPVMDGLFSVSTEKQVKFSRGNLFWNGSAWGLEAKQTDRPSTWDDSHVGHLFWTANAADSYTGQYNSELPWSAENRLFCDGSDAEHTLIIEGSNGFRALSQAEWAYLLNGRANAANKRLYPVTVENVKGCALIAPDNWTGIWKQIYSLADVEAEGLVCLPPAGWCNYQSVDNIGYLNYLTSTIYPDEYNQSIYGVVGTETYNYEDGFYEKVLVVDGSNAQLYASSGAALRLVYEQAENPGPGPDPEPEPEPEPAIKENPLGAHLFTVSPTKKVLFTTGNLYWNGEKWRMEANQTDTTFHWNPNHVSHFWWTVDEASAYAPAWNNETVCASTDRLFCDGSDAAHTITAEGVEGLHLLTQEEWLYLTNSLGMSNGIESFGRPRAAILHKGAVSVAGVDSCIVIAPDDFEGTIADSYTAEEWLSAETNDGLICLPPVGFRECFYETQYFEQPNTAYYWCSDIHPQSEKAAMDIFNGHHADGQSFVNTVCYSMRTWQALPMRLVKTYVAPGPTAETVMEGAFSIGAERQVKFTRGNLYWDGENWQVENRQYVKSLEGDNYHKGYIMWATNAADAVTYNASAEKAVTDHLFCDGSDAAHMLSINGKNGLFAMSQDDWRYLITTREAQARKDLHRFPVTVAGVENCLVLAPDNFEGTIAESYSEDAWIAAEASMGLVCLPPTGYAFGQYGMTSAYSTEMPRYWTSNPHVSNAAQAYHAYGYEYEGSYDFVDKSNYAYSNRTYGTGIRLVQEIQQMPDTKYKVIVKLPAHNGEDYVPGISGSFNNYRVERMIPMTEEGWYTYTIHQKFAQETGYFFFTEYTTGTLRNNHVQYADGGAEMPFETTSTTKNAAYYSYDASVSQDFTIDLSEGKWSQYAQHQANPDRIRELHFYIDRPVEGATMPTTVYVEGIKASGTASATINIEWVTVATGNIFLNDNYYMASVADYRDLNALGSWNSAKFFWHVGENIVPSNSTGSPTFKITGIDIIKDLEDVTVSPAETVTLTFSADVAPTHTKGTEYVVWYIILHDVMYGATDYAKFTKTQVDANTWTLSFPATLLKTGEYQFMAEYNCELDGAVLPTSKRSSVATVTIQEGAVAANNATTTGSVIPTFELSVVEVEEYKILRDDAIPETAIANNMEDAVFQLSGSNELIATETGIETAESITFMEAAEAPEETAIAINAPKPIYTPRDEEEVTLTINGIDLDLDCLPLTGPVAPRRAVAHEAYMAPRRAQLEDGENSVISGFASLTLASGSKIFSPAGAEYDTDARELVDAEGNLVKRAFIAVPDYTREGMTIANFGTICLPQAVAKNARLGATYYNVDGVVKENGAIVGIVLVEETGDLVAGKPYIFEATDNQLDVVNNGANATVQPANGLVGNLGEDITIRASQSQFYYVLSGTKLYHLAGTATATIGQYKAYLNLEGVREYTPQSQVQSRVVTLPVNGYTTDLENKILNTEIRKALIDGKIFIYRGGKQFDLNGRIVK